MNQKFSFVLLMKLGDKSFLSQAKFYNRRVSYKIRIKVLFILLRHLIVKHIQYHAKMKGQIRCTGTNKSHRKSLNRD